MLLLIFGMHDGIEGLNWHVPRKFDEHEMKEPSKEKKYFWTIYIPTEVTDQPAH